MTARDPDTPQFRQSVMRKVANVFPGCSVGFDDAAKRGISFGIKDGAGRYRTQSIQVYRINDDTATRAWFMRAIRLAGGHEDGFPRRGTPNKRMQLSSSPRTRRGWHRTGGGSRGSSHGAAGARSCTAHR